jgi:hypothetical protein
MLRLRTLAAVAGLTIVASAALPATGTPAAATTCAGNLIFNTPLKDGKGRRVGELDIYWDAATKSNCAITKHGGRTWGKTLRTTITLWRCKKGVKAGQDCGALIQDSVKQDGDYAYQAGPVTLKTGHRCIFAIGDVLLPNGHWAVQSTTLKFRARFCH